MRNEASLLDPFMRELARIGAEHNYRLVLDYVSDDDASQILSYQELAARRSVDAVIIVETHPGDERPIWLHRNQTPFVAFGRPWGDDEAAHSWVDVDAKSGIESAVEHLHSNGHRRIGYVGSVAESGRHYERWLGWRDAMARLGALDLTDSAEGLTLLTDRDQLGHALDAFLENAMPTAVVCQDDQFADQALRAGYRAGLLPGVDFAVVGFDDSSTARRAQPPLSTVAQPLTKVALLVWQALLPQIRGIDTEPLQKLIAPTLVIRESSDFLLT